jgi:hypothetical protein
VVLVERGALDFARKTSASLIAPRSRSRSFRRSRTARRCGFRPPPGAISPRYRNLASSPVTRVRIPYAPPLKSPAQATFRVLGLTLLGSWRVTKGLGAHDCNTIDTRRRTPRLSARRQLGTQNVGTSVRDLAGLSLRPPPPGARRRQFQRFAAFAALATGTSPPGVAISRPADVIDVSRLLRELPAQSAGRVVRV